MKHCMGCRRSVVDRRITHLIGDLAVAMTVIVGVVSTDFVAGARAAPTFTATDLGTLGGSDSYGKAINDAGMVVGYSSLSTGFGHGFVWSAGTGMVDVGALPGNVSSDALAINDDGVVVGASQAADFRQRAFSWSSTAGMVDLGTLSGGS